MTLGSLFDGAGTAPLAAVNNGITPVWASEIDEFPIAVSSYHFPDMIHLGDINNIRGDLIPPVDIIVGGSPCQDLSIAGYRAGLESGYQSHLFYEMIRVIKEMRKATNNEYPKYVVWENVEGALSSQKGYDFYNVIKGFCQVADENISIPEPERRNGKLVWRKSGGVEGNDFSVAWRLMDAQYWGVPQRRKRIYLIASYRNRCASEILFEREMLRGDIEKGEDSQAFSAPGSVQCTVGSADVVGLGRDSFNSGPNAKYNMSTDVNVQPPMTAKDAGGVCYDEISQRHSATYTFTEQTYSSFEENNVSKTLKRKDALGHGGEL